MDPLVIPVVAILLPLVLVPTMMVLKHRHNRREWEHLERMKAYRNGCADRSASRRRQMDRRNWRGRSDGRDGGGVSHVFRGPGVGGRNSLGRDCVELHPLISGGAFLTSLLLAFMVGRPHRPTGPARDFQGAKSVYEPDTFDVVSSRHGTENTADGTRELRKADRAPDRQQRLDRNVKSSRHDRECMKSHDQAHRDDRRSKSMSQRWAGESKPQHAKDAEPKMSHAINQRSGLGICLIEQQEVPKSAETQPAISPRRGQHLVRNASPEQYPGTLRLRNDQVSRPRFG